MGAGSGRTYSYFKKRGYDYIALDFSKCMREYAYRIHGEFPYILDDMMNIKKYFNNDSLYAVFAVYSLFNLPSENLEKILSDIYDILKKDGVLLFSYQIGKGENFVDEPYLGENGKKSLYMNYQTKENINNLLNFYSYNLLYRTEKIEECDNAINSGNIVSEFILVKK